MHEDQFERRRQWHGKTRGAVRSHDARRFPLLGILHFPSWISLMRRLSIISAKRWWQNRICWRSRSQQHRSTVKGTVTSNLLPLNRFVKGSTLRTIPCSFAFGFGLNCRIPGHITELTITLQ